MELSGKKVLVCTCGGTIPLDAKRIAKAFGAKDLRLHRQLCRTEIENVRDAMKKGQPILVACACIQEVPLFAETKEEAKAEATVSYVNIREKAGWSKEATQAIPKIAALLAEAALDIAPTPAVTLTSKGTTLIYGKDETAIEAGRQLRDRLDVTTLLTEPKDVAPPRLMDVPIFRGTVRSARGHLGAFELTVDGLAASVPSSRDVLTFEEPRDGTVSKCDLVLDLTGGTSLFPAPEKRDGYFRPDPGNPALVQRALFDLVDMVGEFEKPQYIAFNADICAHSRSQKIGCTRCLDVCPTSAISPDGDHVAIDAYVCAGCGSCAAVCPTGAATYALPADNGVFQRLRTLLGSYYAASGAEPVLLVHDARHGEDIIGMMARHGRGLPARVLPFVLNEVTQVGLDFFAVALAYGATQIRILVGPAQRDELAGVASQIGLIETTMSGLGYGAGRVGIVDAEDPMAVEEELWSLPRLEAPPRGDFLAMGGKRTLIGLGLHHLQEHAPNPVETLSLPAGAPFGAIAVNVEGCTLCLSCVGACPTGALTDDPDRPMVRFTEDACVQCGLCKNICPESVITLVPRFNFAEEAMRPLLIKEEEPFSCVRCGKPFGTRSSIERMVERLAGHSMYVDNPAALDRIKMCADCRVIDQFEEAQPMALKPRPLPRTTEDDLRKRERDRARADYARAQKKGGKDDKAG